MGWHCVHYPERQSRAFRGVRFCRGIPSGSDRLDIASVAPMVLWQLYKTAASLKKDRGDWEIAEDAETESLKAWTET